MQQEEVGPATPSCSTRKTMHSLHLDGKRGVNERVAYARLKCRLKATFVLCLEPPLGLSLGRTIENGKVATKIMVRF